MESLLLGLLSWAAVTSGLPKPATPPPVVLVSPADLSTLVTGRPDLPVLGLYDKGVVFLAEGFDPESLHDRSVLVHELVHYAEAQARGEHVTCADVVARERRAYAAQNAYLMAHASVLMVGTIVRSAHCEAEPAS